MLEMPRMCNYHVLFYYYVSCHEWSTRISYKSNGSCWRIVWNKWKWIFIHWIVLKEKVIGNVGFKTWMNDGYDCVEKLNLFHNSHFIHQCIGSSKYWWMLKMVVFVKQWKLIDIDAIEIRMDDMVNLNMMEMITSYSLIHKWFRRIHFVVQYFHILEMNGLCKPNQEIEWLIKMESITRNGFYR